MRKFVDWDGSGNPGAAALIPLTAILNAVQAPPLPNNRGEVIEKVFTCFCNYASANWHYDAGNLHMANLAYGNCEDIVNALIVTWEYVRIRLPVSVRALLLDVNATPVTALSSAVWSLGANPWVTTGNVRDHSGHVQPRVMFPSHTICKIGDRHLCPTLGRVMADKTDGIVRRGGKACCARVRMFNETPPLVYVQSAQPPAAGEYTGCYYELTSAQVLSGNWPQRLTPTELEFIKYMLEKKFLQIAVPHRVNTGRWNGGNAPWCKVYHAGSNVHGPTVG